jgi:hypothetical protein
MLIRVSNHARGAQLPPVTAEDDVRVPGE